MFNFVKSFECKLFQQRIKNDWKKISPVIPAAPEGYQNFSLFTGNYHLDTSIQDRLSFAKIGAPSDLHPKLQDLFRAQEDARWKMRQHHTVQREKLKLSYEQAVLRVHCNAKRLQENQPKPYSATMFLAAAYENQYESPQPPQPEVQEGNKRSV